MSWLLAVLALGLLVMIHEFGHFIVAKLSGMRVDVFSIGFGPVIPGCRWEWDGTEFVISWVPLGGYVKIAGSNPDDEEDYDPEDPQAFLNQPVWKRMAVVAAGPGINYVFAWLMALFLFGFWGLPVKPEKHPLVVAQVNAARPAAKAGLSEGDTIVTVDGRKVESYEHYRRIIGLYLRGCRYVQGEEAALDLDVMRGGELVSVSWKPGKAQGAGGIAGTGVSLIVLVENGTLSRALLPLWRGAWVAGLVTDQAKESGLKIGDRIVAVDGHEVRSKKHLKEVIEQLRNGYRCSNRMEKALVVGIKRGGKGGEVEEVKLYPDERGLIGVVFQDVTVWEKVAVHERLFYAMEYPISKSKEMLSALGGLLSRLFGGASGAATQVSGPVGIVVAIKTQMRQGFIYGMTVVMFLSVMLGLFNLLPMPALDGGHLMFRLVELITGKRLSQKKEARVHQIALLLLLVLFVLVTVKDCRGLFGI